MKDLSFGLTVTVLGMGITFFTLALIAVICLLLRKVLPYQEGEEGEK
ncbi:MAG: OadG family protein [Dehalococcoidia bacterium]|nr:OadG family protein [Dehalococcoidia bacterium]